MLPLVAAHLLAGCTNNGLPAERLPHSTSMQDVAPAEARVVVAATKGIVVDGNTVAALLSDGGMPHVTDRDRDGSAVRPLVEALTTRARALQDEAVTDPSAPAFRGTFSLEIEQDLPAALVLDVIASAGKAGFASPWLVVIDDAGARRGIRITVPSAAAAAAVTSATAEAGPGFANPIVIVDPAKGFLFTARDGVIGELLVPCEAAPCADWPTVELNRLARRVKLDHPLDRAVILVPDPSVPVQVLVSALDATRDDRLTSAGTREMFPEALLAARLP